MLDAPVPFLKFAMGWLPAVAISVAADPAPRLADAFVIDFGGVPLPTVTCILGALGVALARPLARRKESSLGWLGYAMVSVILLVAAEIWIIDSRPPALFAFVVSIGLGFSGYSLIELVGQEIAGFLKRIVSIPTGKLGAPSSKDNDS